MPISQPFFFASFVTGSTFLKVWEDADHAGNSGLDTIFNCDKDWALEFAQCTEIKEVEIGDSVFFIFVLHIKDLITTNIGSSYIIKHHQTPKPFK